MDRPDDSGRSLDAMCHDIVGRHHASVFRSLPRVRDELARLSSTPALAELRLAFASLADEIRGLRQWKTENDRDWHVIRIWASEHAV